MAGVEPGVDLALMLRKEFRPFTLFGRGAVFVGDLDGGVGDPVAKGLPTASLDAGFEIGGNKRGMARATIHIFDDDGGIIEAPAIIADQGRDLGERIGACHFVAVGQGRVIFEGEALLDHGYANLLNIGAAA